MYQHLNQEQRYQIAALRKAGYGVNKTAREMGVSASTISRELRRNQLYRKYDAVNAHKLAEKREKEKPRRCSFTSSMKKLVETKLFLRWSPEQISGRCKLEGTPMVSPESIYQYVWRNKAQGGFLYLYLRNGRLFYKRRNRRSSNRQILNKVRIDKRPSVVDEKTREGDWELDTIMGPGRKGTIVTSVERKTQFTLMTKLKSRNYKHAQQAIINMFAPYKDQVLTITSDNGIEFYGHQRIAKKLEADYYFAYPYRSWERALNEYHNKLIRQYIPKKSNHENYSYLQILHVQNQLNQRPRKKLNFRTPNELFLKYTVALTT